MAEDAFLMEDQPRPPDCRKRYPTRILTIIKTNRYRFRILDVLVLTCAFAVGIAIVRWYVNDPLHEPEYSGYSALLLPFGYSFSIGLLACGIIARPIDREMLCEFGRLPVLTVSILTVVSSLLNVAPFLEYPTYIAVRLTYFDSHSMMPTYVTITSWIALATFGRPIRFPTWIDRMGMVLCLFWVTVLPARAIAFYAWYTYL